MSPLKIDSSETSTNSLCSCHCHCHEEEIEPLKSKSIEFVDDSAVGSDEIPSSISESRHSMSSKTKKRVSFGRECVREYNVVCEINPACEIGPSIGLGWEYSDQCCRCLPDVDDLNEESSSSVRTYDSKSSSERSLARTLDSSEREEILMEWGIPVEEILECLEEQYFVRMSREKSRKKFEKKMCEFRQNQQAAGSLMNVCSA